MRKFLARLIAPERRIEYTSRGAGNFIDVVRVLRRGKTRFQDIEVLETKDAGRALLLDGILQLTEAQEYQYHEPMAHLPLLAHPAPRRALVIGGGDGALAREILRHPSIERLDFVELDEGVVDFCRRYFPELGGGAFNDPRVTLHIEDGRAFVERAVRDGCTWDAIFMDMTDPAGPSLPLYTKEFFDFVKRCLANEEAFFIMHTESPDCRPLLFAKIQATLRSVFPRVRPVVSHVRMYGGQWSWAICTKGSDPAALAPDLIASRIEDRALCELKILSPATWPALFALWPHIDSLLAEDLEPARDAAPGYDF